jgi:colanic acid biosynthesis glycosyl transferase WcaI
VTVLTAVPHYPSGRVSEEYRKAKSKLREENGVKVLRINLPSIDRKTLSARLYQFAAFQIGTTLAGLHQDFDILLTHTPSIEVLLPFFYYSSIRKRPVIYSVHDLYPEVGIKLGIFRNSLVIKTVEYLENYCLRNARKVRILSKSFSPILVRRGIKESKLALIYDWVDTVVVRPMSKKNEFVLENELANKFILLYAGNIGLVQGLDSIIEAAKILSTDPKLCFLFVGDGAGKNKLVEKTKKLNLTNVRFISYQPRDRMPEVYSSADISLVTLQKGTGFGSLPSKTFQIFSSGRPLIASIDEGSDTWDLIRNADAGLCVPPENPEELAKAILTLKGDPALRERLGRNGRAWAEQHHSPQAAAEQFEKLFLAALETRN